jgi:predicted acetyltransferase
MRLIEAGEEERFVRSVMVPFLEGHAAEQSDDLSRFAARTEHDRAWVEEEKGRFVANCAVNTMDVTVPGGATIKMGGVTAVGVHPSHRRRGLLRQMMTLMLEDCRQRREPVAGLLASESVIYGRFGFGHATDDQILKIRSDRARQLTAPPAIDVELIEPDEARKVLPDLFDRCRRTRAGEPNRSQPRWDDLLADSPRIREGNKGAFTAVTENGFARYRQAANGEDLIVEDLHATDLETEASLWQFVTSIDLVEQVIARRRPVDEPFRWRLADPRRLEVQGQYDFLYLRVLDVKAALEARRYYTPSTRQLTFELTPPATPQPDDEAPGTWRLEVGPDHATCRRTDEAPDLRMEVTDLGSVYLGGFKPSALEAAGRIQELRAGAATDADAIFQTPLAPRTATGF